MSAGESKGALVSTTLEEEPSPSSRDAGSLKTELTQLGLYRSQSLAEEEPSTGAPLWSEIWLLKVRQEFPITILDS